MDKLSSAETSAQSNAEATLSPIGSASDMSQTANASGTPAESTANTSVQEASDASPATSPFALIPEGAEASKKLGPKSIAILSLLVYPGAGQLYRKQFTKGIIMGLFFTVFLVIWGYMVAKGLFNLYGDMFIEPGTQKTSMELGVTYLKRSFIPGIAALVIYLHSAWDAYRG